MTLHDTTVDYHTLTTPVKENEPESDYALLTTPGHGGDAGVEGVRRKGMLDADLPTPPASAALPTIAVNGETYDALEFPDMSRSYPGGSPRGGSPWSLSPSGSARSAKLISGCVHHTVAHLLFGAWRCDSVPEMSVEKQLRSEVHVDGLSQPASIQIHKGKENTATKTIANAPTGGTDVDSLDNAATTPPSYNASINQPTAIPAATRTHKPPAVLKQSDQLFASDPLLFTEKLLEQLRSKDGRGDTLKVATLYSTVCLCTCLSITRLVVERSHTTHGCIGFFPRCV